MLSSIPAPLSTFLKYDLPEASNPVGATRHDASGAAHQRTHRSRRTHAARRRGGRTMCDLLGSHGFKYRTAAGVSCRKSVEMLIEVPFDLSFRLRDEPETGAVTEQCGTSADEEGARVPERIEQARPRRELGEPLLAPREMVRLRACRRQQHFARRIGAGDERLTVIERLRGELSGMVDAHECCARATLRFGQGLR